MEIFHGYVGHNQIVGASVSQQHEQRGYGCVMQNYCTRMCHNMCTHIVYIVIDTWICSYILLLILRSGLTQSARAVSRGQFPPKSATFLGILANTNLVCTNTNSVCASWASCSEVEILLLFWANFSSPQSVSHQATAVRSVGVGQGFDSPLVHCRSVFSCVWACVFWVSHKSVTILVPSPRAQFSQKSPIILGLFTNSVCTSSCAEVEHVLLFWELSFCVSVLVNVPHASITLLNALSGPLSLGRSFSYIRKRVFWIVRSFPRPIFPKICRNFGTLTLEAFSPSSIFPKNIPQFWCFSRIRAPSALSPVRRSNIYYFFGSFRLAFPFLCIYRTLSLQS